MLALSQGVGANTTPNVPCFVVSGPRFGLPPVRIVGVMDSQPGTAAFTTREGQVTGSARSLAEYGDSVMPKNNWLKVGTRKPVLYEPRTNTLSFGTKRNVTFGLVVLPKPV